MTIPSEWLERVGDFDWPSYVEKTRRDAPRYTAEVRSEYLKEFAYQLLCGLTEGQIDAEFVRQAFAQVYAAVDLGGKRRELTVSGAPTPKEAAHAG